MILAAVNFSFGMFPFTTERRFAEILQHILLQTMKIGRVKSYHSDNVCRAVGQYIQGLQRATKKQDLFTSRSYDAGQTVISDVSKKDVR